MPDAILVATLGAEPQVVTLALDQLLYSEIDITRVIVVHTHPNQEPVRSSLAELHAELVVRGHYGNRLLYIPHLLAGPTGPLKDVITPVEIEDAFQSLYTLLRQHKQAGYAIHLCIAGGRKTMALFAMAAAQILFDTGDYVWHLVSNPALLHSKHFHAPDPNDVTLVSVPVARWGRMRPDEAWRAREFIETVLTPAEREVVILLIREGLSNATLADRLGKSVKTIANQLSSVYAKLEEYFGLNNTPDRALLLVLLGSYS